MANEMTVTIYGRLSYPTWNYEDAVARNKVGKYPTDADKVTAEFNLLVEQPQLDKLVAKLRGEFLPYCLAQAAAGEKRNALDQAAVNKLLKQLDAADWDDQPPYIPIKSVPEKTAALAPEAVAMVKVKGQRMSDIELRAIVSDESELIVPDPDLLLSEDNKKIMPIGKTVHQMYAGCYVVATLNLYAFMSGKQPGYSASAGVAVFKADGERFGGGVSVDMDEMFLD